MTTHLYIPFTNFKINKEAGHRLLFENLVRNGPAYKLIVHDSPGWVEIRDKMPWPEMIETISEKKAEKYAHTAYQFFLPVASELGLADKEHIKDTSLEFDNLVKLNRYKQILAYLMIAYDYKARILGDFFLKHARFERLFPKPKELQRKIVLPPQRARVRSEYLEKVKKGISEDEIARIDFIERLIWGYKIDSVQTLSVNKDIRILSDLKSWRNWRRMEIDFG